MKRFHAPLLILTSLLLASCSLSSENLAVSVATLDTSRVINIHESVEDDGDIAKLKAAMDDVGIDHTVLHGIPYDLLHYQGQDLISYEELDENHAFIRQVALDDPKHFSYFCAVDPSDLNRLGEVEGCLEDGGLGVKIYTGYTYAHERDLDDPKLLKIYNMLDEKRGILMLPVNTAKYQDELENVLDSYPNMTVICPHYCLASQDLPRLSGLLDRHANLYVDTSFGHPKFMMEGFETISKNNEAFRAFFELYQDRIMFATDTVITGYEDKDRDWLGNLHHDYLSMLTADTFKSLTDPSETFNGLDLSSDIQKKVFWQNWLNIVK